MPLHKMVELIEVPLQDNVVEVTEFLMVKAFPKTDEKLMDHDNISEVHIDG